MPYYAPQTISEGVLVFLSRFRNRIGRKARKLLMRTYGPRAEADFATFLLGIGPGEICLDMGANVGSFTAEMAARGCEVHAYEPDPLAFAELKKAVGHLPNVTLHYCAVAAEAGRLRLYRARNFADNALAATTMSSIVLTGAKRYQDDDAIDVEVRAFRDVIRGFGRRIALVKMDIEGAEFDILRQIFAAPGDYDIDAIFCETHERQAIAEFPHIDAFRRASASLARPYINLYWP